MLKLFKNCAVSLIAIFSLLFTGCFSSVPMKTQPVKYNGPVFDKTLAVIPLEEMRIPTSFNGWLLLIPLVPYVSGSTEELRYDENWGNIDDLSGGGTIRRYRYRYQRMSKALFEQIFRKIKNSNLFSNVYKTDSDSDIFTDYILKTELISTKQNNVNTLFGLSIAGIFPLLLGIPSGIEAHELVISFRLIENTQKTVIWEKELKEEEGYIGSAWRNVEFSTLDEYKEFYNYLINEMMIQVIPEIKAAIEKEGVKPIGK